MAPFTHFVAIVRVSSTVNFLLLAFAPPFYLFILLIYLTFFQQTKYIGVSYIYVTYCLKGN